MPSNLKSLLEIIALLNSDLKKGALNNRELIFFCKKCFRSNSKFQRFFIEIKWVFWYSILPIKISQYQRKSLLYRVFCQNILLVMDLWRSLVMLLIKRLLIYLLIWIKQYLFFVSSITILITVIQKHKNSTAENNKKKKCKTSFMKFYAINSSLTKIISCYWIWYGICLI